MENYEPQCIIRNIDNAGMPSAPMNCQLALDKAKEGHWGENWQLEEVIIPDTGSRYVLRRIARSTLGGGYEFIYTDVDFESYFKSIKQSVPNSAAIQLLSKDKC